MSKIIRTPSGIGDNIWLIQKLINTNEKFHFILPASNPLRGKPLFDLLPQVTSSCRYVPGMTYARLSQGNIQKKYNSWASIKKRKFPDISLTCNEWLEKGKRIEDFFPDLETSYTLDYKTTPENIRIAEDLLKPDLNPYLGIYTSAYSTARAWGFWGEEEWSKLIQKIDKQFPGYTFVIIGAHWDIDLNFKLMALLDRKKISYVSAIGVPLGGTIEILKRLHYFIGFPSGLSILNETLGKDGLMFYPPHLELMMNAWAHPDRIESEKYKPMLFTDIDTVFKWLIKSKML
jgi:ADP-heptose:LPS heptosyltransferase